MAQPPFPPRPPLHGFIHPRGPAPPAFGSMAQLARFTAPASIQQPQPAPIQPQAAAASTSTATTKTNNADSVSKSLAAQAIDLNNFQGFRFLTLDGLLGRVRDIYLQVSGTSDWYPFEDKEENCITHIKNECSHRRVFLIVSGGLGMSIVPKIHDLSQVYAIYVYCANVSFHSTWAKSYRKIRIVADQDDLYLIPQFAADIARANTDWGDALFQAGQRDRAKEKYTKALQTFNQHARQQDQQILTEIQNKLAQCG